jgi:hypothetical protein
MRRAECDLPILEELGEEFKALVREELAAEQAASGRRRARIAAPAPARSRPRLGAIRRWTVVAALLCLFGGVALAANFGKGGGAPADTTPTVVGQGATADWRLSAYRNEGKLCIALRVGESLTSQCGVAPSGPGAVRALSLLAGRRYVVGLTGGEVARVTVRLGANELTASTQAPVDGGEAEDAGVPAGTRWFVATASVIDRERSAPAMVIPRDKRGGRLGRGFLDCSLGLAGKACEAKLRAEANALRRR